MADLTQFLQLFKPLPGNRYLQVTTMRDEISQALELLLTQVDGKLNTALYNEENLDFSKPFYALPREHDMVILQDIFLSHQNKSLLLKTAYTTLANTANVIIMEKKGLMNIEEIKQILEQNEFRAANQIDILENYDLVMAKKMHMWGNGL